MRKLGPHKKTAISLESEERVAPKKGNKDPENLYTKEEGGWGYGLQGSPLF